MSVGYGDPLAAGKGIGEAAARSAAIPPLPPFAPTFGPASERIGNGEPVVFMQILPILPLSPGFRRIPRLGQRTGCGRFR